ncbi:MAG: UDP-N-acetylmuramoyl-L-alanine--D-glutamate ligase [Gammaproteobacteria bacterium]|nr:MAG: UDP-N-acetylmuramoyl-L-alanine--D-glutamate ligase [Gammaproteobacteria bacterium]
MNCSQLITETDQIYPGMDREDASVLVVGMGATGLSVAHFLAAQAIRVMVVDSRKNPPELEALQSLLSSSDLSAGDFSAEFFDRATHIVVSPGVSLDLPELVAARAAGKVVLGDIDLFFCQINEPVIAITGSNGKSTVTTLVGLMAEKSGRKVAVGGNLGRPALDLLREQNIDLYVLELSSFQLDSCELLDAKVATVLNVTEDHLDRYVGFGGYLDSKKRVFNGTGVMVLNRDDPQVMAMGLADRSIITFGLSKPEAGHYGIAEFEGESWFFKDEQFLLPVRKLKIKGHHNQANALAALALGESVGLPMQPMLAVLSEFKGLDHRMQWVAEIDGVEWINDSKATNVGACQAALDGLSGKVVLIAGGDGKGADFSPLVEVVRGRVKAAILTGKDAKKMAQILSPVTEVINVADMHEAVLSAAELAEVGDTVLLSPACASLDQYSSYQARGNRFVEAVEGLVR